MRGKEVRIIHHPTITLAEITAVARGLDRFKRHGISITCAVADSPLAFDGVMHRALMRKVAMASDDVVIMTDMITLSYVRDVLLGKDILGLAITPKRMYNSEGTPTIGLSAPQVGAFISLSKLRQLPGPLLSQTIEVATRHEAGYLLELNHCNDNSCVMQGNKHLGDFLEVHVRRNLDFCSLCSATLSQVIGERLLSGISYR